MECVYDDDAYQEYLFNIEIVVMVSTSSKRFSSSGRKHFSEALQSIGKNVSSAR